MKIKQVNVENWLLECVTLASGKVQLGFKMLLLPVF